MDVISDVAMKIYATVYLLILITIAFLVQITVNGFTDNFVLVSKELLDSPWTLLTSIFLHGSMQHFASNFIALTFFGFALEGVVGRRRLLQIFLVTGIAASMASSTLYASSLGASGAIFGLIGALTVLRPRMTVYAFSVPMPMVIAAAMWAILDIGGLFYPADVANLAHLAGLAAGLVIGYAIRNDYKEPKRKKAKILTEKELQEWENRHMRLQNEIFSR